MSGVKRKAALKASEKLESSGNAKRLRENEALVELPPYESLKDVKNEFFSFQVRNKSYEVNSLSE